MSFDITEPFALQDALAAGLTRGKLRGPGFRSLAHGVYVAAEREVDLAVRCRAALLGFGDDAHVSHYTAAELLQLWIAPDPEVHVCRSARRRTNQPGVRSHQCQRHGAARQPGDIWVRRGIPVSSPVRVFLELSDCLSLVPLVALGDSIVRRGWATPQSLVAAANAFHGDGALRAREAASLVRLGADSRPEVQLRLLLRFGGLPEPEVNIVLRRDDGSWRRRMDLGYRLQRVAAEYDGAGHRASDEVWDEDLQRRESLAHEGWQIVVVMKKGIYRKPRQTVDRVHRALTSRGWRGTLHPRADFDRHFPTY